MCRPVSRMASYGRGLPLFDLPMVPVTIGGIAVGRFAAVMVAQHAATRYGRTVDTGREEEDGEEDASAVHFAPSERV